MSDRLPQGTGNCFAFAFGNAICFQIFLGAPMILYAKTIGAGPVVLGVIASLTPLLTIMQIPGAYFMQATGYKKMLLMGWTTRNLFVLLVAILTIVPFLHAEGRMALLLVAAFAFNLSRGFTSGAWMPWITDLIPEQVRGLYLSREQLWTHAGCLLSAILCAVILRGKQTADWQFGLVFLLSFLAGAISLFFMRRVPVTTTQERLKASSEPVPWGKLVSYPPFLRLTLFNLLYSLVIGSLGVFVVSFLRERTALTETEILLITSVSFVAAGIALPWGGRMVDRFGSRPLMRLSLVGILLVLLGWCAWAVDWLPVGEWWPALLFFVSGASGAMFSMANVRLVMMTMPPMGRNHFFAFYTVTTSLGLGGAPIFWGMAIEAMEGVRLEWLGGVWGNYGIYFGLLALLTIVTFVATLLLIEKGAEPRDWIGSVINGNFRRLWRFWIK